MGMDILYSHLTVATSNIIDVFAFYLLLERTVNNTQLNVTSHN